MKRACEWRCYMKSTNPNPQTLILQTLPKPTQQQEETQEETTQRYDTGIQENNHDDPTSEPGFYIRKQTH